MKNHNGRTMNDRIHMSYINEQANVSPYFLRHVYKKRAAVIPNKVLANAVNQIRKTGLQHTLFYDNIRAEIYNYKNGHSVKIGIYSESSASAITFEGERESVKSLTRILGIHPNHCRVI